MSCKVTKVFLSAIVFLIVGCSGFYPKLQNPEVKVVAIRLLSAHGLEQHVAVDLNIVNPNKRDLTIRSMRYNIGVENIKLFSGENSQVPLLKSQQETPVTLDVSLDVIQGLRLIEHFTTTGVGDNIHYNVNGDIDFSAWLPSMHFDKKGVLPLGKITH